MVEVQGYCKSYRRAGGGGDREWNRILFVVGGIDPNKWSFTVAGQRGGTRGAWINCVLAFRRGTTTTYTIIHVVTVLCFADICIY